MGAEVAEMIIGHSFSDLGLTGRPRMVYYIRFLKTPVFKQQRRSVFISALICITTDLGDDFLAEDVDLIASWAHPSSRKIIYELPLKWQVGSRQLSISLGPFSETDVARHAAVLIVRPKSTHQDTLAVHSTPLVISGCSAPFQFQSGPADKLIGRNFAIKSDGPPLFLRIWEETGNSIARHIW